MGELILKQILQMVDGVSADVDAKINAGGVVVFSKSYCPFAAKTKSLFKDNGVSAVVIELDQVDKGADMQAYLKTKTGQGTVPNVFINKAHIGGNDKCQALHSSGDLKKKLDEAGISHSFK